MFIENWSSWFYVMPAFQGLEEECSMNMCGDGFSRWFDKCLTITVYENGVSGGNVEHTTADATVS